VLFFRDIGHPESTPSAGIVAHGIVSGSPAREDTPRIRPEAHQPCGWPRSLWRAVPAAQGVDPAEEGGRLSTGPTGIAASSMLLVVRMC
jgi:hypothetical protein